MNNYEEILGKEIVGNQNKIKFNAKN